MTKDVITLELFDYFDLSDDAKKSAYNEWRKTADYQNRDKIVGSFQAFCRIFPVQMVDSYLIKDKYPYVQWKFTDDDELRSLSGTRLWWYLAKEYGKILYKNETRDICPLTGYYADYIILNPIYEFLEDNTKFSGDYELLLDACVDAWSLLCNQDLEQFYSMESFLNQCEINNYKFLANGRMF